MKYYKVLLLLFLMLFTVQTTLSNKDCLDYSLESGTPIVLTYHSNVVQLL